MLENTLLLIEGLLNNTRRMKLEQQFVALPLFLVFVLGEVLCLTFGNVNSLTWGSFPDLVILSTMMPSY